MRALGRLFLVPLGFLLAIVAAVTVLVTLGLERYTKARHAVSGGPDPISQLLGLFDLVIGARSLATIGTLLPALLVVIVGEIGRIRSPLYYILGGGLAMAALPLATRIGTVGSDIGQLGLVWQVFATAGFAGGGVYWMIAGRGA